jgi:hypothetical protein
MRANQWEESLERKAGMEMSAVPPEGLEVPPQSPEKTAIPNPSGTDSGTLNVAGDQRTADSGTLDALAAALIGLSSGDRAKLAALLLQTSKPATE